MRFLILCLFIINIFASELNQTDINLSNTNSKMDTNISDINDTNNSILSLNLPTINEENVTNNVVFDNSDEYQMNIALFLNKKKFFKFIPNILNSINAYMLQKDINYHIQLFDLDNNLSSTLNKITPKYQYIFLYLTSPKDLNITKNYPNNYFFIPTLNKNQSLFKAQNVYFGGINYQSQVSKLSKYIDGKTIAIYNNTDLSKYITQVINNKTLYPVKNISYPIHDYKTFNNKYIYLNTEAINSVQILSNFTYNKIQSKAILSTQINYTPIIFLLTNPFDTRDLILANSITNINIQIENNNLNLNSNINFNWLNYTTSTLLNIAYNIEVDNNIHYLNDFDLYMFFNQVIYKTNLYKIFQKGFIKVEN